jgi:serine/threonine-protein kinase RsbT
VTSEFSKVIASRFDVEEARRFARAIALGMGFPHADAESVVLAVSELGMNLLRYAEDGSIAVRRLHVDGRVGVEVESIDAGPGIPDIEQAMADGYSTGGGLGLGLSGVRRLMDEFSIESCTSGTRIQAYKWLLSK